MHDYTRRSKKNSKSRRNKSQKKQSRRRSNYLRKDLVGGFIRAGVPQYSYCDSSNPVYSNGLMTDAQFYNRCLGSCDSGVMPQSQSGGFYNSRSRQNRRNLNHRTGIYYRYI